MTTLAPGPKSHPETAGSVVDDERVEGSGLERPARASGIELLGPISGTGYRQGAALVRRADGQMVQLGPLMYGLLECMDGQRDVRALTAVLSSRVGRPVGMEAGARLVEKLGEAGLLSGSEHLAPPRRNPLLALRWKYLVTSPRVTRWLTAPFTFVFRPWIMWPALAAFVGVCWYVLFDKGVAAATAQAFDSPGLLLLIFALTVVSAGFHELGHAAACRYGGAEPRGMGVGIYLVWPAFYTDVTDAYRLPRKDRLRVDLAGLYFNAIVAVATMAAWLFWRLDALLLLVALQLLQMVRQLSPIIRADGYHILADTTGVPNLYAHMGPTLRRLMFWRRQEPSALTGWARVLVTAWVLVLVPVLMSLLVGAVLLLPHLLTNGWDSGRGIGSRIPGDIGGGHLIALGADLLRLLALFIPVAGSLLVTQKVVRTLAARGRQWSEGSMPRRGFALALASLACVGLAYAWWPAGQYQPVTAADRGTLTQFAGLVADPGGAGRPAAGTTGVGPNARLAVAFIPVDGASSRHPAVFILPGTQGQKPTAIISDSTSGPVRRGTAVSAQPGAEFPFALPSAPGRHGTQALALNTKDGSTMYNVAYSLVTVRNGAPVDETNSAYAIAHCQSCTTVAVSFQLVLVIGQSNVVVPTNAAGALNYDCPSCVTTAIADQLVVTLTSVPPKQLVAELDADLRQLNAISQLGSSGTPSAVAAQVAAVQQQIESQLAASGLEAVPSPSTTTSTNPTSGGTATGTTGSSGSGSTGSAPATGSTSSTTTSTSTSTTTTTVPSTAPTTTTG